MLCHLKWKVNSPQQRFILWKVTSVQVPKSQQKLRSMLLKEITWKATDFSVSDNKSGFPAQWARPLLPSQTSYKTPPIHTYIHTNKQANEHTHALKCTHPLAARLHTLAPTQLIVTLGRLREAGLDNVEVMSPVLRTWFYFETGPLKNSEPK